MTTKFTFETVSRRYLPLVITTFFGILQILWYFLSDPTIKSFGSNMAKISTIIMGFGVVIASIQMIIRNQSVARDTGRPGRIRVEAILLIFSIALVASIGISLGITSTAYKTVTQTVFVNWATGEGIYGALWFMFLAYRGFRIRSMESLAFFIPGILMILGNSSWASLWISPALGGFGAWMTSQLIQPVSRGILIGGSIGAIISSVRTLMGRESFYMRGG